MVRDVGGGRGGEITAEASWTEELPCPPTTNIIWSETAMAEPEERAVSTATESTIWSETAMTEPEES